MSRVLRQKPLPVTADEFARLFRKSLPPVKLSPKIAVANSGGLDSTCLLFLIDRFIRDARAEPSTYPAKPDPTGTLLPTELVSLSVDHGLQDASAAMAQQCAKRTKAMGIPHITSTVPWSTHPFPDRPNSGEAFEEIGRNVRYQLLFQTMNAAGADILALGHHADDQVETSLMRLAKGTTEIGAGGMRRCRRWGMGSNGPEHALGWCGLAGMFKYMVRPLLEIPKDRLLATAEENNLEYVTDATNFQPELTLRNAIRALLAKDTFEPEALGVDLPPDILEGLKAIQKGVSSLQSVDMDLSGGPESIRAAVTVLSEQVEDIDSLVDSALSRCRLPSPPGTYLVSYRGLSTVHDPLVRRALVLRVMRFVSFHPWGTIRADGNRRRTSLDLITRNLWTPNPFESRIPPFVAGGGVLWTPCLFDNTMHIPTGPGPAGPTAPNEIVAWLASRQPPISLARMHQLNLPNNLRINVTDELRAALHLRAVKPGQVIDVLYDNRFAVSMDVDDVPDDLARAILRGKEEVKILPNTRWYWPKVIRSLTDSRFEEVIHTTLRRPEQRVVPLDVRSVTTAPWAPIRQITSTWIRVKWIRSISAL